MRLPMARAFIDCDMTKPPNATAAFLRFLAIVQMLTGGLTLIPNTWLANWHAWLGLGHLPNDAVLRYGVRGGAFVQGAIGILIWIMATDIVRYRPLVLAVGWIYLASGPAFYLIDSIAGMPFFWCAADAVSCFAVGSIVLALALRNSGKATG